MLSLNYFTTSIISRTFQEDTEYKTEYKTDRHMFDSSKNNHVGHQLSMVLPCKEEIL